MRQINNDAYITRAQAAMLTGVSADAINKWRARGWRSCEGELRHLATKPGRGRTLLFRVGDILEAERDTRSNPNCRRPAPGILVAA